MAKARAEGAGGGGDGVVSSSRFKKEINTNTYVSDSIKKKYYNVKVEKI